jgi:hypothetical protein
MDTKGDEGEAPKATKARPKGVQFASARSIEQVKRISRYSNYAIEEIESVWGDGDEHKLRKQELRTAVTEWQQGRRMSDNLTFTTKGIADKVGPGRKVKKDNRTKSRQAVMDEQELQEMEGMIDDELLGDIYTITTAKAKQSAHEEALNLEAEVKNLAGDGEAI